MFSNLDYVVNDWSFLFGTRFDYRKINAESNSFENDFNALSTSLGFSKTFNDHKLKFSYSSAFRTPHISELLSDGVHHATKRYEVGDPNLIEEKGNQLDLTYEWSDEHLGFILNPFIIILMIL